MAGNTTFGFDCKLYIDSASAYVGDPASPTWQEVGIISDAVLNIGHTEADASIREAGALEITEPGLLQLEVTGKLEWRNGNTICQALWTAFTTRAALNMWALTGSRTVASSRGFRGDWKITKFPINQELKELTTVDIVFKPCRSSRAAANYVVSANGTP